MISRTKALNLAFLAVTALSALAASAAQAGSFDVGAQPAVLTGQIEQNQAHVLITPLTKGGVLETKCTTATYESTVQGQVNIQETTITTTYANCKMNGLAAVVRMNGCKITLTGTGQPVKTGMLDVTGCTAGKQIEAEGTATGCLLTFPEQNNLSHMVFSQVNAQQLTDEVTVTGITYTLDAKCGESVHHGANATFTGNTFTTAWTDTGGTQVTKHGHQYTENKVGTQVSITAT